MFQMSSKPPRRTGAEPYPPCEQRDTCDAAEQNPEKPEIRRNFQMSHSGVRKVCIEELASKNTLLNVN